MGILLDLILIAFIILMGLISAKRGFVRVAIEVVGFVAAIMLSLNLSVTFADLTYQKVIEPKIISSAQDFSGDTTASAAEKTWESLPGFIKNNAEKFGINKDDLTANISENIGNGAEEIVSNVSQNTIKPVAVSILKTIYLLILMSVLMIVVKLLARTVNKLFSFSLVGKLNRVLGGTVGIVKGVIFAWIFCMVIALLISLTENGFWIFNTANIENSYIFKFFTDVIKI